MTFYSKGKIDRKTNKTKLFSRLQTFYAKLSKELSNNSTLNINLG